MTELAAALWVLSRKKMLFLSNNHWNIFGEATTMKWFNKMVNQRSGEGITKLMEQRANSSVE